MVKTPLCQFDNIKDDLFFWIKQFIGTKIYSVKEKKPVSKEEKATLHVNILNAKNIDELREYSREARRKGLYSLPEYLNPSYLFFAHVQADKKLNNLKDIDTTYVHSYIISTLSKLAPYTQNLHHDQIKSLFKFIDTNNSDEHKFKIGFLRSGKRATSPTSPKAPKKQTFLEPNEFVGFLKSIRNHIYKHPNPFQTIMMIKFLCFGGLRKEELVDLKLNSILGKNINIEGKKYLKLLVVGKGSKERLVYINYSLIKDDYEKFLEIRNETETDSDALFIASKGNKYSSRTIEDIMARAYRNSGLGGKGYGSHTLRRSFAYYLYAKGVSIDKIGKLLGHSSTEMTEEYIFLFEQKKYEIVDLLENI